MLNVHRCCLRLALTRSACNGLHVSLFAAATINSHCTGIGIVRATKYRNSVTQLKGKFKSHTTVLWTQLNQ